jgi:hypothetical protein
MMQQQALQHTVGMLTIHQLPSQQHQLPLQQQLLQKQQQ